MTRVLGLLLLPFLCLAGCASATGTATSTSERPTSSASSTPSVEEDVDPVAAELLLHGWGVEVVDAEGDVLGDFEWADPPAESLEVLELALGEAPEPFVTPGDGAHIADFDTYEFDGAVYSSARLDVDRDDYFLPAILTVTSSSLPTGVAVRTPGGLRFGDTIEAARGKSPAAEQPYFPEGHTALLFEPVDPAALGDSGEGTDTVGAVFNGAGMMVELRAPFPSFVAF